jgi:hypothetical protein
MRRMRRGKGFIGEKLMMEWRQLRDKAQGGEETRLYDLEETRLMVR